MLTFLMYVFPSPDPFLIQGSGDANQGLVKGHGYIMTDLRQIQLPKALKGKLGNQTHLRLVRLRNPWGTKEWTGAWSDE